MVRGNFLPGSLSLMWILQMYSRSAGLRSRKRVNSFLYTVAKDGVRIKCRSLTKSPISLRRQMGREDRGQFSITLRH